MNLKSGDGAPPVSALTLEAGEIHIWVIPLTGHEERITGFRGLLSPDEITRADRFYFERDRQSFTVARAAMRLILGLYVHVAAETLVFSYGAKGKPELKPQYGGDSIRFNLSHSGEFAVLAVSQGLCLGVDIEFVNAQFAGEEIAERFFSRNEVDTLRAVIAEKKAEAFFSCWTRKEAYIKALGEGLSVPLDSFDVAFGAGVPPALLSVRVSPEEVTRWRMYELAAPAGYKAALVVEGHGHRLRQWQWKPEF